MPLAAHRPEPPLFERIETLLAAPEHGDNPLRAPLAELFEAFDDQLRQMDRITRISDGYQAAERARGAGHAQNYREQLRRLEKIVRISDRYQGLLRELNQRLEWLSNRDALTGLPNRRHALTRLNEEFRRTQRTGRPLAIALVDIDHFKTINDTWGHEVGDEALAAVAGRLSTSVREYDLCARWGGEEFLVLLPETTESGVRDSAERLRASIASDPFMVGDRQLVITVSLGAGTAHADEDVTAFMKRVDDALYRAKHAGRNRLELAPADTSAI
ncbi:biofilm regulation diguanylate cyclase SiaD [Aromatoleum petrolei]|uniref:diguanylate cyclase n=1 Tax=Aromatoleum petrolei TaxID=76116 RepID=A0ABX1MTL1_9RHOO|nr:biofilm regulation diguanylate cyclase SiaD [Aromatoleum petrolei]NMF90565.1 diguanylate cyclase [Aromatoleum petrolei]QTQ36786.1 Diguanylate cyclase [Aromatoleum petrolei]